MRVLERFKAAVPFVCFVLGAIFGVYVQGDRVKPGEYMLRQWKGTRLSPNYDANIFTFEPYDDKAFEGGDYSVEVDREGKWHLIPSA